MALAFLSLTQCQKPNVQPITKDNIKVVKTQQHPFLADHRRIIKVEIDGKVVSQVKGYGDPGSGCDANLFESPEAFIVIDCNGSWYFFNKASGKLIKEVWNYEEDLPENYLGTFKRQRGKVEYQIVVYDTLNPKDVYKFKDPADYLDRD